MAFVEIENCCEAQDMIDSSGLDDITMMWFLFIIFIGIHCAFGKVCLR
jgi:hypothetical protein